MQRIEDNLSYYILSIQLVGPDSKNEKEENAKNSLKKELPLERREKDSPGKNWFTGNQYQRLERTREIKERIELDYSSRPLRHVMFHIDK